LIFEAQGISQLLARTLNISIQSNLERWNELVAKKENAQKEIKIAIAGKYTSLEDSYASIIEALNHCSAHCSVKINYKLIETSEDKNIDLNGFDGVIVFTPLTQEEIVEITRRMIASLAARLEAKGIHFRVADEVLIALAQKGYDPVFGARPLRRLVQEEVDNAIAQALLRDEVKRRDTIVLETGGIRIEKAVAL